MFLIGIQGIESLASFNLMLTSPILAEGKPDHKKAIHLQWFNGNQALFPSSGQNPGKVNIISRYLLIDQKLILNFYRILQFFA